MAFSLAAKRYGASGSISTASLLSKQRNLLLGSSSSSSLQQRWLSGKDAGDVIGIDLGTTNSCVAVMVSSSDPSHQPNLVPLSWTVYSYYASHPR